MTEVPKIVYDRLRAASLERALPERALPQQAAPEPAHPDADLLTAFAEQALSATEREDVIGHLALCGDCREVIALALPAADPVGAPIAADTEAARAMAVSTKSKRGWLTSQAFAWPSLRWAALAAGVAVAASVLLMHPGKLNQATLPSATPQVATTVPPASDSRLASSPMAKSSADLSAALAQTGEARFNAKSPWSKKAASEQAVTAARAKQGILLADNKPDNRKDAATADKPSPALSTGAAALDKTIVGRPSEVVEVTAESPTVQAEVSADDRRRARSNAPAIEKAKPARRTETGQMQNTISANIGELPRQAKNEVPLTKQESPASQPLARNVTWAIKTGILQRSLDSGQSWQNALRADHSLLCYASHDEDVWAGGQAGKLFHSSDGGVTWMQVQASVKGQALTSDVTHIDVRSDARGDAHGLAEIVLSTRNNETWSSLDAGKTWEKK